MMKKRLNRLLLILCVSLLCTWFNVNAQNEADYTVPSWTLYKRAVNAGNANATRLLVSKDYPYNVNTTIHGDPTTQMGATWFTNAGIIGGKLQLVEGKVTDERAFASAREISAHITVANDLMYLSSGNNNTEVAEATGFEKGTKRSYHSNKVLMDGLKPGTTYSYRVGKEGAWSEIGSFTTAKNSKDEFEFIYVADTQANTDDMFAISKKTIERAYQDVPDAKFLLIAGDLVETSGANNSEWEWEQWFETMQGVWYNLPIVPVQGNHDTSANSNMSYHFHTDNSYNESQMNPNAKTAMDGTVYSFVYGDALFMVINYEDYKKGEEYFSALESWMEEQVATHQDVSWRIVSYHKTMFTGSNSHQSDTDGRTVRERFAPVFQRLGIDLALQGHDHIYEVIGVLSAEGTTYTYLPRATTNQQVISEGGAREDMTGLYGGTFDVSEGVLYFLNNSAGRKKYEPRTATQMDAAFDKHGIEDYFTFFNRFGQTGEPTFSRVKVSSDVINISTYTVDDEGNANLFDEFNVEKLREEDYTVPSWTLYKRALKAGDETAKNLLVSKDYPYNVNTTIHGDPATQIGAAWFTNANVTGGKLQLVEGKVSDEAIFASAREIEAATMSVDNLMYISSGSKNDEVAEATGFEKGTTRSYVSNKVLIDSLSPNTTYSYRVGKEGAWSEIGNFTTAKDNKDEFEFIYVADTQANTDDMFTVSKKTIERAYQDVPDAKFLLIAGDLVETSGANNSEWEWEQWFERMQGVWYNLPIVPIQGNHDTSVNSNMYYHFHTDVSYNASQTEDDAKTAMDGTVYSFVYGDALFMIINHEDYKKGETYFAALEKWMEEQVEVHSDVRWRIVSYHKAMFTGSKSHQSDSDGRIVRERFAPVFQRLGIDVALQGHDHIYEVIGVLSTDGTNYSRLEEATSNQERKSEGGEREDMTGLFGGTFDVSEGVLYFLNNSAGKKKYEPRTEIQMNEAIEAHGIENYFTFFNRFGQTGEPTFSRIKVSSEQISISTYTVDDEGNATLFDEFNVEKAEKLNEADYTVPSWTLYLRALLEGNENARDLLVSKDYPYNVNTTINGDPATQIGAAWFTNAGVTDGKLQLVEGKVSDEAAFASAREIEAVITEIDDLVYIANSNNNTEISEASGLPKGTTRSYTSNKVLIDNLQPGTTYSYRVGKEGAWSEIGTFTTAKNSKDEFDFIYVTDTQANTDDMFTVSKRTIEAAFGLIPEARFLLCAGDFVETYHIPGYEEYGYSGSAEWEWEQWFERMQETWLHLPIVPIQGNHDISPTHNLHLHFNTDVSYNTLQTNEDAKTNMDGTIYSFVYGDALFLVLNYENIPLPYTESEANDTYVEAIADWMRAEVAKYENQVKWKITAFHKSMFTGSSSHQDDQDGRFVREKMAPVFSELGIDLALQGHDHVYEVIGVLKAETDGENITYTYMADAVSEQEYVTPTDADGKSVSVSVTGKEKGTYNVEEGTLYFLNNSAGKKKYYPRNEEQMTTALDMHHVEEFFAYFNKFGQTGEPTFSHVKVTSDDIHIVTYTVNDEGETTVFDSFKLVKIPTEGIAQEMVTETFNIYPNPASNSLNIEVSEEIEAVEIYSLEGSKILTQYTKNVDLTSVSDGFYLIKVTTASGKAYTERFIVKK